MTGAQWLELLYRHIPDRYEHLVRYVGWYSNRVRSQRTANDAHAPMAQDQTEPEVADRAKAAWARLIQKVYEVDPLECPKCGGPMRVIAVNDDASVIERILKHLNCWAPRAASSIRSCGWRRERARWRPHPDHNPADRRLTPSTTRP